MRQDRISSSDGGFSLNGHGSSWGSCRSHVQDRPTFTHFETPESILNAMCESAGEEDEVTRYMVCDMY